MAAGSLAEFLSVLVTFIGDHTDSTYIPITLNEPVDLNKYFNCSKWMFNENEVTMPIKITQGSSKSGGSGTYHCGESNIAIVVGGFDLVLTIDKTTITLGDDATMVCTAKFWSTFRNMESHLSLADSSYQILDETTDSDTSDSDALSITATDTPDVGTSNYLCTWTLSTSIDGAEYSREFVRTKSLEVLAEPGAKPVTDPPNAEHSIADSPVTGPLARDPPGAAPSVHPGPEANDKPGTPKVPEVTTKSEIGGAGDETRRHSNGILVIILFSSYFNLISK